MAHPRRLGLADVERGDPEQVDRTSTTREAQGFNSFYLMAMVHPGGYDEATHAPEQPGRRPAIRHAGRLLDGGRHPESERTGSGSTRSSRGGGARHGGDARLHLPRLAAAANGVVAATSSAQPDRDVLVTGVSGSGERYGDDPNIIWFGLGDFTPPEGQRGGRAACERSPRASRRPALRNRSWPSRRRPTRSR